MKIISASTPRPIKGQVNLPASKSISNRALIINTLSHSPFPIENLSDCDDTRIMVEALHSGDHGFDIGHAGTAMRFLTAYFSQLPGAWELTGSERMQQRPIGILVDALNQLGAHIEYAGKNGYPPLRIFGSSLTGGTLEIPASVSSQYISALMMIAPYMSQGMDLRLTGKIVSPTYIDMTYLIMQAFGADISPTATGFRILPAPYTPIPYRVEADWSAASYFYELLVLAGQGEIEMQGLTQNSMQGDARQVEIWEQLGVTTTFKDQGILLTKTPLRIQQLEYDFIEMPDLVQSFAVACCLSDIPFSFTGVETLRIKETDRIQALTAELAKLGYRVKSAGDNRLFWEGEKYLVSATPEIATYHDHRMAMSFAPAILKYPDLVILDKGVTSKSFPHYWDELKRLI